MPSHASPINYNKNYPGNGEKLSAGMGAVKQSCFCCLDISVRVLLPWLGEEFIISLDLILF